MTVNPEGAADALEGPGLGRLMFTNFRALAGSRAAVTLIQFVAFATLAAHLGPGRPAQAHEREFVPCASRVRRARGRRQSPARFSLQHIGTLTLS